MTRLLLLLCLLLPIGCASSPEPEPEQAATRHVVVPGDTLAGLATLYYGSEALWLRIYEANRDRLPSPAEMRVGMELVIPGGGPDAE